ncbi:collagen alpha-1(I) chain-like [Peromyscus leucopus]|uniref:collagen alpha-1(I) chain-like n=1 Tax=Peromyscus leucopus TaxID=10041 RepID=UPI0010A0E2F1|nr:collagen alpha-1(I) chain-like [Peromyscus leucopus]
MSATCGDRGLLGRGGARPPHLPRCVTPDLSSAWALVCFGGRREVSRRRRGELHTHGHPPASAPQGRGTAAPAGAAPPPAEFRVLGSRARGSRGGRRWPGLPRPAQLSPPVWAGAGRSAPGAPGRGLTPPLAAPCSPAGPDSATRPRPGPRRTPLRPAKPRGLGSPRFRTDPAPLPDLGRPGRGWGDRVRPHCPGGRGGAWKPEEGGSTRSLGLAPPPGERPAPCRREGPGDPGPASSSQRGTQPRASVYPPGVREPRAPGPGPRVPRRPQPRPPRPQVSVRRRCPADSAAGSEQSRGVAPPPRDSNAGLWGASFPGRLKARIALPPGPARSGATRLESHGHGARGGGGPGDARPGSRGSRRPRPRSRRTCSSSSGTGWRENAGRTPPGPGGPRLEFPTRESDTRPGPPVGEPGEGVGGGRGEEARVRRVGSEGGVRVCGDRGWVDLPPPWRLCGESARARVRILPAPAAPGPGAPSRPLLGKGAWPHPEVKERPGTGADSPCPVHARGRAGEGSTLSPEFKSRTEAGLQVPAGPRHPGFDPVPHTVEEATAGRRGGVDPGRWGERRPGAGASLSPAEGENTPPAGPPFPRVLHPVRCMSGIQTANGWGGARRCHGAGCGRRIALSPGGAWAARKAPGQPHRQSAQWASWGLREACVRDAAAGEQPWSQPDSGKASLGCPGHGPLHSGLQSQLQPAGGVWEPGLVSGVPRGGGWSLSPK